MTAIDLNADLGETTAGNPVADDAAMLGMVSSANVATGFHAGDPHSIAGTLKNAAAHGVTIGAHVAYNDPAGFGRRFIDYNPAELADEMAVIRQEAHLVAEVPDPLVEILARFTRGLRESSSVDQRSGVSARFSIAGAETTAAAALRRATVYREDAAVARLVDIDAAVDGALMGFTLNSGQACESGTRVFVHADVYDRFNEALAAKMRQMSIGPGTEDAAIGVQAFLARSTPEFVGR